MARSNIREAVKAREVQQTLLGRRHQMLQVVRQACRQREDHTDELLVLRSGRDVWLAARLGDRVNVWTYHDVDAADDAFEARVAREVGWRVAAPAADSPAA